MGTHEFYLFVGIVVACWLVSLIRDVPPFRITRSDWTVADDDEWDRRAEELYAIVKGTDRRVS